MDVLTQGLLGAALAQSVSKKDETRKATTVGFLSGLLADADVLIQSSSDSLLTIEYHRHFTHSLFFIPFGALLASLLLWVFFRNKLSFQRLYLYAFMGYSLSGFIDACTSYGTYLFWPFSNERVTWHLISIIDPIFTGMLLIAVVFAVVRTWPRPAWIGLSFCSAYLVMGWMQLQRAETVAIELAQSRGHEVERLVVKPTLGNIILWRSIYESAGRFYVDGLRVGVIGSIKIYAGESVAMYNPDAYGFNKDSVLYHDILRFRYFSDNFMALNPKQPEILGDVRYSMVPTSVAPLWGITLTPETPERHAKFDFFRSNTPEVRGQFFDMVMGR